LYAANAGWPPQQARSTLQSFFLVQNLLTVAVLGVVLPGWTAVGALVLGTAIGMALAQRLPVRAARAGVLLVSAAGGVALIVSSL
jgi:uncharacterized membrane protein YfcA